MRSIVSGYVVTSDHCRIHYNHYKNGQKKVIVIAHGFFNNKDAILLRSLGRSLSSQYDVILFDFRGHGKSGARFFWTAKEYLDLLAVLKYAQKNYSCIGVIGFSLGAATSIIAAAKTDLITSLVAVSAPTQFRKIDYHFWKLDVENDIIYNLLREGRKGKGVRPGPFWFKKQSPIDLVKDTETPIFYIHGSKDWIIKPQHSRDLYKNTKGKKKIVIINQGPHAEYLIRKNKKAFLGAVKNWFKDTLKDAE